MKRLVRLPHQGPSGYVALMIFILIYTAAIALVIAPETRQVGTGITLDVALRISAQIVWRQ